MYVGWKHKLSQVYTCMACRARLCACVQSLQLVHQVDAGEDNGSVTNGTGLYTKLTMSVN